MEDRIETDMDRSRPARIKQQLNLLLAAVIMKIKLQWKKEEVL
jgi:hypothetical protein